MQNITEDLVFRHPMLRGDDPDMLDNLVIQLNVTFS